MPAFAEIKNNDFLWIDVNKTGEAELAALHKRFGFLRLDLEDCKPPLQRAKFVAHRDYLFVILLFPVRDKDGRVRVRELDFFLKRNTLVTVHTEPLPTLSRFLDVLLKGANKTKNLSSTGDILYKILDDLLHICFAILTDTMNQVEEIEDRLENLHDKRTIGEIFKVKTNIVNFKKAVWPHKSILRKLIAQAPKFFEEKHAPVYFEHLVGHTKEVWDQLERHDETIRAIEDTHISLLNFRTNDIMRVLTIFAVIVFPLTLLAAIFGMNVLNMPIVGHPADFWIILFLMALGTFIMIAVFKLKKWL